MHFIFHVLTLMASILSDREARREKKCWFSLIWTVPLPYVLALVPVLVFELGNLSDSIWIRGLAKICTVLAIVAIPLLAIRWAEGPHRK